MKLQLTPETSAAWAAEAGAYTALKDSTSRVLDVFRAHDHQPFTRRDVASVLHVMGAPVEDPFKVKDPDTGKLGWQVFYPLTEEHGLVKASRTYYAFGEDGKAPETTQDAPVSAPAPEEVVEVAPEAPEPVEAPVAEETEPEAPVIEVAPEPETPEPDEVGLAWLPETPDVDAGYYEEDEGLRRMAVSQSSCFGNFYSGSKACGECPLARFCAPASLAAMADIAAELDRKTEEAMARATFQSVPEPDPTPEPTPDPDEDVPLGDDAPFEWPEGWSVTETPFDSFCSECRGEIPEGGTGVHVPGKGMMHVGCAKKVHG